VPPGSRAWCGSAVRSSRHRRIRVTSLTASWALLATFWLFVAASIVVANLIYPGADWYKPSLSHFGEAGAITAPAYNSLQVVAALALFGVAVFLPVACRPLERAGLLGRWRRLGIGGFLALLSASLATLAVLPFNLGGPFGWPVFVIHNVAGWTEAVAPATAIAVLPWAMPVFRRGFYAFSWACLLPLAIIWYAFVWAHVLAHGLTELIAYGIVGVWGFAVLAELTRALRDVG
jgi:hypothetical protein